MHGDSFGPANAPVARGAGLHSSAQVVRNFSPDRAYNLWGGNDENICANTSVVPGGAGGGRPGPGQTGPGETIDRPTESAEQLEQARLHTGERDPGQVCGEDAGRELQL